MQMYDSQRFSIEPSARILFPDFIKNWKIKYDAGKVYIKKNIYDFLQTRMYKFICSNFSNTDEGFLPHTLPHISF